MFRNTFSKVGFTIVFFLLITLTPFLLHAELEREVKFISHATPSDVMFIFQASASAAINLYLAGPNGQIKKLTHNGFSHFPNVSPDGKTVFFDGVAETKTGDMYQIFKLDLDSKKITQISDGSALDSNPVCAPDGKHLAFCSLAGDPNTDIPWRIYIMDINGKNRNPLDTQGDTNQLSPSWSPDSAKVVFVYTQMLSIKNSPFGFPIVTPKIRDLKTKTTSALLPAGLAVNETTWSPLGDRIAFRAHDPLTDNKTIWTVGVDGLHLERVTDGPDDAQPGWWPDGSKLVFSRIKEGNNRVICMVDLKTREVTELFASSNATLEYPQVLSSKSISVQSKRSK